MKIILPHKDDLSLSKASIDKVIGNLEQEGLTELNIALTNLLKASSREIDYLIGHIDDLALASMNTRNIFEIYLILLAVSASDNNLKRWFGQSHRDSKDIRDGFIKVASNKGLDVSELEEIQRFDDQTLEESPYKSERGFNIKELAKAYGYLDDYMAVYKLSSKLVHPTSMKVNSYEALLHDNNYLGVVIQMGMFFSQKLEHFALDLC